MVHWLSRFKMSNNHLPCKKSCWQHCCSFIRLSCYCFAGCQQVTQQFYDWSQRATCSCAPSVPPATCHQRRICPLRLMRCCPLALNRRPNRTPLECAPFGSRLQGRIQGALSCVLWPMWKIDVTSWSLLRLLASHCLAGGIFGALQVASEALLLLLLPLLLHNW